MNTKKIQVEYKTKINSEGSPAEYLGVRIFDDGSVDVNGFGSSIMIVAGYIMPNETHIPPNIVSGLPNTFYSNVYLNGRQVPGSDHELKLLNKPIVGSCPVLVRSTEEQLEDKINRTPRWKRTETGIEILNLGKDNNPNVFDYQIGPNISEIVYKNS